MRIAIASRQVAGVTGTTTTILEHSRRLRDRGVEVHVYGEKLDAGRLAACGAVPHRLPGWPWGSRFKRGLFSWIFDRAMKWERFDLVWGHGDTLNQDVLSLHNCVHAAHEAVRGTPLPSRSGVGMIHGRTLAERRFRLLIANSGLMKEEVVRRFNVPADSVRVIHPGHDPARFRHEDRGSGREVRRGLGVGDGEFLVGLVSSGDLEKRGVRRFLEALGGLPPELRKGLHALVVGRESRIAPYREAAAAAGLGPRIHFRPPSGEVAPVYHALDLYVHPALYEEFGQSVQEAMACGVPVLTNARVGASELLAGKADMVLPGTDAASLRGGIEKLLSDPGLRQGWGRACCSAARGNTWDRNFDLTWECLQPLLQGEAAASGRRRFGKRQSRGLEG
ncbi:MAG: glycosyltransferase family 4 protein [Elusimicrobia bacterium]|nr:glycosyltransferase family 4 protein [Elusimicrobiota bacterium]